MPHTPAPARCHLAWHLTSRCNLACPHCLRETPGQATRDLQRDECLRVLESFITFAQDGGREASIEFSGGNPLLHRDFPELIRLAQAARVSGPVRHLRILGNPETLDGDMAHLLGDCRVDEFWISLDGREAANDRMRGRGSFRAAMRGLDLLAGAGIPVRIKFTLVRENAGELNEVLRLAIDRGIPHVGLGPLILSGGGYHQRDHALDPLEYRRVLLDTLCFLDGLPEVHSGFRRAFLLGNRMYALLFHELGRNDEYQALLGGDSRRQPPGRGGAMFVVWSDGEVVLRREMQRQGWVPRDSFQRIYDQSYLMHVLEDQDQVHRAAIQAQSEHVRCHACPVATQCPPGMVGTFGARLLFLPNEHCWRARSQS